MSGLAKYVLYSGIGIGLAWTTVSVEIQGRTPYGHFLEAGGAAWVDGAHSSWDGAMNKAGSRWDAFMQADKAPDKADKRRARPTKKSKTPTPSKKAPPAVQEASGAKKRVALLKAAQRKVEPKASRRAKTRTTLDDPTNKNDRAALDRLVAGR